MIAPARLSLDEPQSSRRTVGRRSLGPEEAGVVTASGWRPESAVNSAGCRRGDGVGSLESCKDEEGGLRRETYRTAVGGD